MSIHSKIDLEYINASDLTVRLSECKDLTELANVLIDAMSEDLANANGYLRKYDNAIDRIDGTCVADLKAELFAINNLIAILRVTARVTK